MPNDDNKIILEFPATNVEIELGETITFDNISGFLNSDRVTYDGESLTDKITHLENDKADASYVNTELAKKADKTDTYTKTQVDNIANAKLDKANPTGSGSLSLNRKPSDIGNRSVAVGDGNTASGTASFAMGTNTIANHKSQYVFGEFNTPDDSTVSAAGRGNYIEIVGNGTGIRARSNARTLDWQGNETLAGNLTFNGNKSLTSEISRLDGKIDTKANASDVYTKSQTDTLLNGKANASDAYTKQESDQKYATKTELSAKADVSAIPTKTSDLQNDSNFAQIEDTSEANNKAWSAEKTAGELDKKIDVKKTIVDNINWADYGSTTYTLGWRVGQYNYQTGADQGSSQLMKVLKLLSADGYDVIKIKPPTGYFIQIAEYSSSTASALNFVRGVRYAVNEVAAYSVTAGHYYGVSVGYWSEGDATDYITEAFISQIVGTFERVDVFVRQTTGQSTTNTMSQKAITDAFIPYTTALNNTKKSGEVKATINLTNGNEYELDFGAFIRKNWRLSFSGEIANFNACKIGFNFKSAGLNPLASQAGVVVEITDTKVIVQKRTKPYDTVIYVTVLEENHGLTIADYLQVVLSGTDTNAGKILLECNGSVYTQDISDVEAEYYYKPFIQASDCDISNGTLSYTCTDFDKQVLIVGDSYTRYVNNRWPYWLHQWGYDKNCVINGHGGAKSVYEGYRSTEHILEISSPKYILWCLGMNDGSDTDENTPNANWVEGRDFLLALCSQYGYIPVFTTIPNARNSNGVVYHNGKNKWIRNSGYQYVDFAKAVGADDNGDWRTGLRESNTGLHPSELGAKVLCMQVLADFPQIMIE